MPWHQLPNVISGARLLTVPILVWMAQKALAEPFAWLLLVAGLSDVLDGWLARHFGWTSRLGALLDSSADIALVVTALYGIWEFHRYVYVDHWPMLAAVIVIWSVAHVAAFARYARPASFHTRLTQLGLMLFGAFVIVLLFYRFLPWLFYVGGGTCFLAGVETLIMIALVRDWTPDLRGGLLQVVRQRS